MIENWWSLMELNYACDSRRAYHTFTHIRDLLEQLDKNREKIEQPDHVELAIFFHDLYYEASQGAP